MRIALFGPPGAGKGTQAQRLRDRHDLTPISTGNLIREAIRNESALGRIADSYVSAGSLVPDELVRDLANEAIADCGFERFILDGYPRTIQQATWLLEFLEAHGAPLHAVISLDVPDERIVERLSKRRINKLTGESYHLDTHPPPSNVDPALIIQRSDDEPEKVLHRLETYRKDTKPVEEFFRSHGLLVVVQGVGSMEDVQNRIQEHLAATDSLQSATS